MEFKLNEDQQMIHDLAKDFAETVLAPRIEEIEEGEMVEVSRSIPSCPTTFTSSWLSAASSASASPRSMTAWVWATWSRPLLSRS